MTSGGTSKAHEATARQDTPRRAAQIAPSGLLVEAVLHWCASLFLVLMSADLAPRLLPLCKEHPRARRGGLASDMAAWDGVWYRQIVTDGYSYAPRGESSVAFFPAYPLTARVLAAVAGVRAELALLIVSNACFLGALLLAAAYARERFDGAGAPAATVAALAWFPTTFYFRMAYSESLLLLLIMLALYGIRRGWPAWRVALVVGAATATRPVGLALMAPLTIYLWRREDAKPTLGRRARHLAANLLLWAAACWGLLAFIGYQAWVFGEPLAFMRAHSAWNATNHRDYALERAIRLLTFEPIRAVYDPSTSFYWALRPPRENAALNLMFANPICFLATAATIGLGAAKRWLTMEELSLAALLLLIPYALRADQTCMASQARFASVALPAYLVWGRIVAALPVAVRGALWVLAASMLAVYSALFVSWYWFY